MNIDILLKRFNHIKKMWLNALEGSEEQKILENQMEICLKDIKSCKSCKGTANRARIDYGANVLSHYLSDTNNAQNNAQNNAMEE